MLKSTEIKPSYAKLAYDPNVLDGGRSARTDAASRLIPDAAEAMWPPAVEVVSVARSKDASFVIDGDFNEA